MPVGRRPMGIDSAQNLFGGGNGVGDNGFVGGTRLEFELSEAPGGENRGGDEQDTFASFVHGRQDSSFAFSSPFELRPRVNS